MNFYQKTLKKVPIKTTLNALFLSEWLIMNVPKDRPPTGGEMIKAMEWADELTAAVMNNFERWEESGKP